MIWSMYYIFNHQSGDICIYIYMFICDPYLGDICGCSMCTVNWPYFVTKKHLPFERKKLHLEGRFLSTHGRWHKSLGCPPFSILVAGMVAWCDRVREWTTRMYFSDYKTGQPLINCGFGAWWFGILGVPPKWHVFFHFRGSQESKPPGPKPTINR